MNIHEYQAKQLFKLYGIAVPEGAPAETSAHAEQVARGLGGKAWVIKAQVHAGGRGKAGGVKIAENYEQVKAISRQMLGGRLVTKQTGVEGLPVDVLYIEQTSQIEKEFYLGILVDRSSERVIFIASASGGMDIEEVAATSPDKLVTIPINPAAGLQPYQCRKVAFALGLESGQFKLLEKIMAGMYRLMLEKDASQIEINPLVVTDTGELVAVDAKINFDDNAVAAHADITALRDSGQEDEKEHRAQQFGLNYITLDGTIGCMVNGAGLAMATMDLVKLKGGQPANFLDVGGGTNPEKVAEAFKLILADPSVKAVLVNIFGGIVKCNVIAEGIIAAVKEVGVEIPVVVRLEGTNAEEGRKLLSTSGLNLVAANDLSTAAEQVVALAGDA